MFHTEITEDTEPGEKEAGVLLIFYLRGRRDLRVNFPVPGRPMRISSL